MSIYLYIILAYILVLMGFNFYRSFKVRSQDDFMVAGRSLSIRVMVFTLICTWIGSGTFIAGAEYAAKAGWSALWLPAGAWFGIIVIYFLAAKIRTFGQYTIGDILEARYGPVARVLNIVSDGAVSVATGQLIAAFFVIFFTALAGMMAVAYTDLPNGIVIVVACLVATPFVVLAASADAGGVGEAMSRLPDGHLMVFNKDFGAHPLLKAGGYFLATLLLLMGVQSMYQKFYSAKTPKDAKQAVALWVVGTIVVETVVVVIAVFAASYYWPQISTWLTSEGQAGGTDPASIVLQAARGMVPVPVGVLLLAAACAVVISTGMNYLLSPSTNVMRDVYQRFINPGASQRGMVALQKVTVIVLGVVAFLLSTQLRSVLEMSYFAYTVYGVGITPALIAALAWKRATKAGGLASIIVGSAACILLGVVVPRVLPQVMVPAGDPNGDPWGIPLIYPALVVSVACLVIVSLLTRPPAKEELAKMFPEKAR